MMKHGFSLLLIAAAIAGCAHTPPKPAEQAQPKIAQILPAEQAVTTIKPLKAARPQLKAPANQKPPIQPITSWTFGTDKAIHVQLQEWARLAGWRLEWRLEKSWMVPAPTEFHGTYDQMLEQVVGQLYAEGKPVRLVLFEGNHYAEIVSNAQDAK